MVNPAIVVKPGARVSIQVINADPDTAHGLVVTASEATSSWMPMMTARPAFPGSALWFLGKPHRRGHARRNARLHRQYARDIPLPVPGPRTRPRKA